MKLPRFVPSALAAALLILLLPAAATAAPGDSSFDLDFPGGTAAEYVRAIRAAAGPVNIVVMPRVETVRIEPMKLTNVSVYSALELLEGEYEIDGNVIKVGLDFISGSGPDADTMFSGSDAEAIFKLVAQLGRSRDRGVTSRVWSIASILDRGNDAGDVLTAIEAALELSGDAYQSAKLRFHRETRLLLARGDVDQVQVIEGLLSELADQRTPQDRDEQIVDLRSHYDDRVSELEAQADGWRIESEGLRREGVSAHTRAELLMRQIERLEEERSRMQDEMRRLVMERDTLMIRMANLEKEFAKKP